MQLKRPLFLQRIKPQTFFTILIFLIIFWIILRPLQEIGKNLYLILGSTATKISDLTSQSRYSLEELLRSRNLLRKQSNTLSFLKIKLRYLENEIKEVENLKNILKLQRKIAYKTHGANVIGRTPDNWHKQIIINKGSTVGVMIGDSVLSINGIIGQVVEANKNTSIIQLVSDPTYKVGCKIGKKNILGILAGKTNSISIVHFVPVGSRVKIGDLVTTSGISSGGLLQTYPPHHPIGKVSKVSKKKSKGSDLYIEVMLFEDLSSLNTVLVFSPG